MKCPECGYDQKVKYGLTCGECNYTFCFNPKESGMSMTDGKFLACIRSAGRASDDRSREGAFISSRPSRHQSTQWFTENQLYAAFCRRMSRPAWQYTLIGLIPMVFGLVMLFQDEQDFGSRSLLMFLVVGGGVLAVVVAIACHFIRPTVDRFVFDECLKQWKSHGRSIDKLLSEPSLHEPPPEWTEPDIYDYGVERVLIVERDILVDLFVRNGFHAEQRTLVLSESGYPSYLVPVARKLIEERSDLPVFLLHDATAHGAAMENRIRAGDLLPLRDHPVTDVGLFPADFQRVKHTKTYAADNKERDLPVDALTFSFLTMGMVSSFTHGENFSTIISQQGAHSGGGGDGGGDFG